MAAAYDEPAGAICCLYPRISAHGEAAWARFCGAVMAYVICGRHSHGGDALLLQNARLHVVVGVAVWLTAAVAADGIDSLWPTAVICDEILTSCHAFVGKQSG